ncbi:SAFB-like transcription modulator isoform X2 [Pararge aegeria]|uniref:SAFB-like transcription modulator n=1 Tax=Pararge aegeria TaxID=116150 RepID=S4P8N5_9NEOP|nr:SAFB-like transcription modulator isoform X2 [Pararge aegeria]
MSDRKRLLDDLRVIDLRAELEKRNLDKSGVRGVLIKRLTKHLVEEGHDPETFTFELSGTEPKTPSKRSRRTESSVDPTDTEDTPALEDMIVQDTAGEEEQTDNTEENKAEAAKESPTKPDLKMDVDESEKVNRKRESKDEPEATQAKKQCTDKDVKIEEKLENTDAEDSINLDIGDDELLNEETDNNAKNKKDDDASEEPAPASSDDAAQKDSTTADITTNENQQVTSEAAATSIDTEKSDKDEKDDKDKDGDDKREKKDDNKEGGARNLWVSGLSGDTRAKDLKQLCSKHGKVIGAKVVTNARTPGSRCYGYVTMASAQDAENCIKNLHRTELHGRMISVEKAKSESESSTRRQPSAGRPERRTSKDRKDEAKENQDDKEGTDKTSEPKAKKEGDVSGAESTRSTSESRGKSHRSDKDKTRHSSRNRETRRSPAREVLSFSRIWKERDVARARERSRAAREEERRRRAAEDALRERERRQRIEKNRLAVEREKLRAEREKIEREKNELLRLERERHRLEREKLELERLELKRAQLRLEEERRKRGYESGTYRKPAVSPPPEPAYERDSRHKRPPPPQMASGRGQFEAPPPPRFEMPTNYDRGNDKRDRDRDYKRDYPRHVSSGNMKYPSNGSTNEDTRQQMPPGTRLKEPGRSYDAREGRSYRPSPPGKPEPRNWNASNRYPDAAAASKGSVSGGGTSGGGEAWTGGEPRYGGGGAYEPRYPPSYPAPPPAATYPDRYPSGREYARKY